MDIFQRLPVELWLVVTAHIKELDRAEVSRLSRTSRNNYILWTPWLYTTVTIKSLRNFGSLAAFAKADSQTPRWKLNWTQRLLRRPMWWRKNSPWRYVRNLRIILHQDPDITRRTYSDYIVLKPAQAILNACAASLVNICVAPPFENKMMRYFMQLSRRCRVMYQEYPGIFSPWSPWHFLTTRVLIPFVQTFDRLRYIRFERPDIIPTSHIVFGCSMEALHHLGNIACTVARLLHYIDLQRIVLILPTLQCPDSVDDDFNHRINQLRIRLKQLMVGPLLVVVRREIWVDDPSDAEMNDRRWSELALSDGDTFWECGDPIMQIGDDDDDVFSASSHEYADSNRLSSF
ncbi:hypothetical protein BKA62DRAFT_363761 [Auriculariales sp. MPI-PUGE-AT-0066]|nr:hypothetical protein BKA62DRAFT_363761 [Auriculariales sp. MPI-PUGE-AT-0066]